MQANFDDLEFPDFSSFNSTLFDAAQDVEKTGEGFEMDGFDEPVFKGAPAPLEDLPPVPEYYEPYTSFTSDKQRGEILDTLRAFFLSDEKDRKGPQKGPRFEYTMPEDEDERGNQIHVVLSEQGQVCLFTINLYSCSGRFCPRDWIGTSVLFECCRQSGCTIQFNAAYSEIAAEFGQQRRRRFAPPMLPKVETPGMTQEEEEEAEAAASLSLLKSLVEMAKADYISTKREGVCHLSYLSESQSNQKLLTGPQFFSEVVPIVEQAFTCNDRLTLRAAAILLKNLLEEMDSSSADPDVVQTLKSHLERLIEDYIDETKDVALSQRKNLNTLIIDTTRDGFEYSLTKLQSF